MSGSHRRQVIKERLLKALLTRLLKALLTRVGKIHQGLQKQGDHPKLDGTGVEWIQNFLRCKQESG